MAKTTTGLEFILSAKGADGVVKEIGKVQSGIADAGSKVGAHGDRGWSRWKRGIADVRGALGGLLGQVTRLGAISGIGVGIGFASLAKDIMAADDAALQLQYGTGATGESWKAIQETVESLRSTTGLTGAELYKIVDTANDFGLSVASTLSNMEGMVAFAKLLGVNVEDAVMAVGALDKATGGTIDKTRLMGMVGAAARATGGDEGRFLSNLGRSARLMGPMDEGQTKQLLQVLAGAGQSFLGQEKVIFSALKSLETLKPEEKKRLGANMGQTGAETLLLLASALNRPGGVIDGFDRLPSGVQLVAQAMAENVGVMNDVGEATANAAVGADGFAASLEGAKKSQATSWAGLMEDIKKSAEPIVRSALAWALDNRTEIVAAFKVFFEGIREAGDMLYKLAHPMESVSGGVEDVLGGLLSPGAAADLQRGRQDRFTSVFGPGAAVIAGGAMTSEERQAMSQLALYRANTTPGGGGMGGGEMLQALAAMRSGRINITLHVSPDGVATKADEESAGQRRPATVTVENS